MRSSDRVNILITGGSVALGLGRDRIERAWARLGDPRKPYVFSTALGGYKEPQQAMSLAYLVAAGAQFDLIINVDGYNDVVVPYLENYQRRVSPLFPRAWRDRVGARGAAAKFAGELLYLNSVRDALATNLAQGRIYRFATAGLYAFWRLSLISNRLNSLARSSDEAIDFERSGPYVSGLSRDEVIKESVEVWARSSLLMHGMAQSIGATYVHVLQPNQYAPDSKPFTPEELKFAVTPGTPDAQVAAIGYPLLIARGREIGPYFADATNLFINEQRTVYADNCCHFNQLGYETLAEFVVRTALAQVPAATRTSRP